MGHSRIQPIREKKLPSIFLVSFDVQLPLPVYNNFVNPKGRVKRTKKFPFDVTIHRAELNDYKKEGLLSLSLSLSASSKLKSDNERESSEKGAKKERVNQEGLDRFNFPRVDLPD